MMEIDESESLDIDSTLQILDDVRLTENELESAVLKIKRWLTEQPHLPPCASDEKLLKAFIIGCNSIEEAKTKIDLYFKFRHIFQDSFFFDRDPTKVQWSSCQKFFILPGLTSNGRIVVMATMPSKGSEIHKFDLIETIRVSFMMWDYNIRHYYMNSGVIIAFDMSNVSGELIPKIEMDLSLLSSGIFQECYPLRIKSYILFNAPPLAETMFDSFMKPFFNRKLQRRVFIYPQDHRCLEKHGVPVSMLPCDYIGGRNTPIEDNWNEMRKKLEKEKHWFLTDGSQKSTEHLRPKQDKALLSILLKAVQAD